MQSTARGTRFSVKSHSKFSVLLFPVFGALASCGGGSGPNPNGNLPPGSGGSNTWTQGVYKPSTQFDSLCVSPRAGTSDRQGTVTDQNNWLRSWTNELYLWYGEVT